MLYDKPFTFTAEGILEIMYTICQVTHKPGVSEAVRYHERPPIHFHLSVLRVQPFNDRKPCSRFNSCLNTSSSGEWLGGSWRAGWKEINALLLNFTHVYLHQSVVYIFWLRSVCVYCNVWLLVRVNHIDETVPGSS